MTGLDSYDRMSEEAFEATYLPLCGGEPHLYGIDARFRVYRGDVTVHGDLDLDAELARTGDFGMVVEGSLRVDGVLFQDEFMVGGSFLFVLGSLRARALDKGAGAFYIRDDLHLDEVLFSLPDDEGYLEVGGHVHAAQMLFYEGCSEWAPDLKIARGTVLRSERLSCALDARTLEERLVTTDTQALRRRIRDGLPILREA